MCKERIKKLVAELSEAKNDIRILNKIIKNMTKERKESVKGVYDSGFREGYGKAIKQV